MKMYVKNAVDITTMDIAFEMHFNTRTKMFMRKEKAIILAEIT